MVLNDVSLAPAVTRVGRLHRDTGRRGELIRFEYDAAWLANPGAFAIEPLLPLNEGSFHPEDASQPHGIFQDC